MEALTVVLKDKTFKYGESRVSLRIPKELEGEIKPGEPVEVHVDRTNKAVVYVFPNSEIQDKKIVLKEEVVDSIIEKEV